MPVLRSLLFAPGNHPRRVTKALASQADAVILDLEDACPLAEKVGAREAVMSALRLTRRAAGYVRINALSTAFAYGDLQAVVHAGVDGIMLTKVESVDQLHTVDWLISQLERERQLAPGSVDLIPLIETAKGFAALPALAGASKRVRRLAFGAGDLTTDLGITWTSEELELLRFRTDLILASRVAGLEPPIDLAWIAIHDKQGLGNSIRWGQVLGFQGKLCIHPDHLDLINSAFTPSESQVTRARRIIEAFEIAEAAGSAAIQVDGALVDYPIVYQAQRTLELSARLAKQDA